MAQMVLGIDLGSHSVKVARLEVGMRKVAVAHLETLPVPSGPEPQLTRSLDALQGLELPENGVDLVTVGLPGDKVLQRLFEIPITDVRRLAAVVENELADDIPWDIEDVLFDHAAVPQLPGQVMVVATRSESVGEVIQACDSLEMTPRNIPPAPLSYGPLLQRGDVEGVTLVADIGHNLTNLCLISEGKAITARTISRGGFHLTEAIRRAFQISFEEAEEIKEREAQLAPADAESLDPRRRALAKLAREALEPLVRQMRLTLGVLGGKLGHAPDRILICGGTSLLPGMEQHLATELGVPCQRMVLDQDPNMSVGGMDRDAQALGALSLGLCLQQGGRTGLDLRQGEYAFRTDSSIFREKLVTLAVSTVLILIFLTLNALSSLYSLQQEDKVLRKQLRLATRSVFGEVISSPNKVSRMIRRGSGVSGEVIPEKSAFDLLNIFSRKIPVSMEGETDKKGKPVALNLDIARLDIKQEKTLMSGTADSRSQIDTIVKAIQTDSCVSKVTQGKISTVAEEKKQFSLTIYTECF